VSVVIVSCQRGNKRSFMCPVDVYEIQEEKSVPVNGEECLGCESCMEVCEQEAITVTEI